jgi:tripartite-type tricarboxylate transporter receptor subunit TctC
MQHCNRRTVLTGLLAGAAGLGSLGTGGKVQPAHAQSWPNKPILFVVPFPAGGTSDTVARLVAQELTKLLGQAMVVENRAGANGNIGSASVARAAADGYTVLLSGIGSNAINHGLYPKMPYDSNKDFTHITQLTSGPNVLVVNGEFPAKTFKEFVDLVKANPDKYNYASSGSGSSGHLAMELLKQSAGLKIVHVPYKGGAPAMTDVMGGQVAALFVNQDVVLPHVKSGKLRILAVASEQRNPLYPDTPTVAESGFPGFSAVSWNGLSAPANLPKDILARLHADTVKALQSPALKERLESTGFIIGGNAPEQYSAFIASEIDKWTQVAKIAGATVD